MVVEVVVVVDVVVVVGVVVEVVVTGMEHVDHSLVHCEHAEHILRRPSKDDTTYLLLSSSDINHLLL